MYNTHLYRQSVRQQASIRKSAKSNKSKASPTHPKSSKAALPDIPTRPFEQRGKSVPFADYLNYQPPDSERQGRGKSEPFPDYLNYQPPASPGSSDSEEGKDEPFPDYLNYQPPPVSSDSDQENMVSKNKKKLETLKEEDERDIEVSGQHGGSLRALLQGRGDVKNRIKAFEKGGSGSETSSLSSNQSEESIKNVSPRPNPRPPIAVPRTRIRNQPPAQAKSMDNSPPPRPPHPQLKSRAKSVEASLVNSTREVVSSRPPPPPSRPSPTHIALSPKKIPVINEELVDNKPPPVGPGHPLRPNRRGEEKPVQPPRPSLSVYKRAKDRSRSASPQLHRKIIRPPNAEREDSEDSDTASSVHSYKSSSTTSSGRPQQRHKVKKVRSQSSVDQPRQDLLVTKKPTTPSRRKSASESTDSALFPPLEAPPKNTMDGAVGGEKNPLNEDTAGSILKYILSSPDPKLKAALKDLLKNDTGIMNSLQDSCK